MDISQWVQGLFGGAAGTKVLGLIFRQPPGLKVCTAHVIREGRGWPWNKRVSIHPLKNGTLEITPL